MTLLAPGLWLQRLTTREPTLDQLEVSIRALREVLRSRAARRPRRRARRGHGLVPRVEQTAEVSWEGNVARGSGSISAQTRARSPVCRTPWRRALREWKRSELAAAHAGCFAMSLATELSRAGSPPERLDVEATVTLDEVAGEGHRIVASELRARARVPGLDAAELERLATVADEGCTFSALVRASATVTVNAELEEAS